MEIGWIWLQQVHFVRKEKTVENFQGAEVIHAVGEMYASSVDKDAIAKSLEPQRELFGRSLVLCKPLNKGAILAKNDVCLKKPGKGIKASQVNQVLGKKLIRDVSNNRLLRWDDLGD